MEGALYRYSGTEATSLFLQFIRLHHPLIRLCIVHAQVIEDLAALGDLAKEPPARGFILRMLLKMLHEEIDLFTQERNLHLRRTRVLLMGLMLADEFLLDRSGEHGKVEE